MLKEGIVPIALLILAAGSCRRMGRPKGLLEWHGKSLLAHQCHEALASELGPVRVVVGAVVTDYLPEIPTEVTVIHHKRWQDGKVSSILAGMKALPNNLDGVLFLSVDQPCGRATMSAVARALAIHPVAIATHNGTRGHPVAVGASLFDSIQQIDESRLGLRILTEGSGQPVAEVAFDDPSVLWNFNTPKAYLRARQT